MRKGVSIGLKLYYRSFDLSRSTYVADILKNVITLLVCMGSLLTNQCNNKAVSLCFADVWRYDKQNNIIVSCNSLKYVLHRISIIQMAPIKLNVRVMALIEFYN